MILNFDRILAPTDFSHHAEGAVRAACELAERFEAELHLLHVLSEVVVPAGPDPMLVSSMPPEYYQDMERQSQESLNRIIGEDWPKPTRLVTEASWGDPVDEILRYASDHGIDLIVCATHGRTGLAHVLLGSVAERIVREAPCPVLSIRDKRNG